MTMKRTRTSPAAAALEQQQRTISPPVDLDLPPSLSLSRYDSAASGATHTCLLAGGGGDLPPLLDTLKRIRISRSWPGQLRLQRDVAELRAQDWMRAGFARGMDVDPNDDSVLRVEGERGAFLVHVDKRYPHVPPVMASALTGERIALRVLEPRHWNCTLSLVDVFRELLYSDGGSSSSSSSSSHGPPGGAAQNGTDMDEVR